MSYFVVETVKGLIASMNFVTYAVMNTMNGRKIMNKRILGIVLISLAGCGKDGLNGAAGRDGVDANSITIVKLCPGETKYPSKFIEVAFCIENTLYGTYSANGGFSTELPPGTYGSNGINASCNFAVLPNCGIQN